MTQPIYKTVRLREDSWQEIKHLADQLSKERGATVSLPATIAESIKFFQDQRHTVKVK
ncbi:MAG: hypothetical protein NVS1B10_08730 [Candidatus Saccharimonadales bacterium]